MHAIHILNIGSTILLICAILILLGCSQKPQESDARSAPTALTVIPAITW